MSNQDRINRYSDSPRVIDGPIADGNVAGVWWPAASVLFLGTVDAVGIWVRRYLVSAPSSWFETSARASVFGKLQRLSVSAHEGWESGQLLSRAIADLSSLRRFIAFVGPFLIINTVTIVIGIVVLLVQSWQLGVILVVTAVPLVLACTRFEALYRVVARDAQDQAGDVTTTVEESVQGIRVLKAFGRSAHMGRRFLHEAATLRDTELTKVRYLAILWTLIVGIPPLGIGAMLAFGAYSVAEGTMTVGALVAAMAIVAFLLWPIEAFGFLLAELNNARTAADRYWEILDTEETITEPVRPVSLPRRVRGVLEFDGVGLTFPDASAPLLAAVDFRVHLGEIVALVGITGSGKTALTNLVPRLFDVTAGSITIDGIDIASVPLEELRSSVSVAFEDPVLFSASVRENIALGRPDASDVDIDEALDIACAREFVERLPWGLRTPHRRAGHELVRWSASATCAGSCRAGQAAHPRTRRPAFGARRRHRSHRSRQSPTGPGALDDASRRPSPVHRGTGRQGATPAERYHRGTGHTRTPARHLGEISVCHGVDR